MKLLLTLFCFAHLTVINHNGPMAVFKIYQESETIHLDITLDAEDLAQELRLGPPDISKDVMEKYLRSNTSFIFDNIINELDIVDFDFVGEHLKINGVFITEIAITKQLEIINNCLLNVDNQSNIIQIDLNGDSKDYRMHKKRNSITVDL